jgi:type I restriction enzyme S subunit
MELKPGYKLTEVGVIPEDWNVDAFGKVYAEPSRNGIYKSAEYQGRGIRIVNMGEMFGLDFISDQEMNRISLTSKEIATTGLRDGDLLFGRRSVVPAGAGKCSIVITPPEPMTFESSIIRVRLNKAEGDPLFHYYFFASSLGRAVMSNIVSGTNIKGIRGTELRELKIPRPPLPEQRLIASTLSDMDELLGACDCLIAKKRDLKQAAMQQLLTGKTRLPGFDGEWEVKRLGDVVDSDPENLGSDTRPDLAFNYIALEDVDRGFLRSYTSQIFANAPSRARRKLRINDVLVSTVRPNLQSHLLFKEEFGSWVCSTGFCVIRCREELTHPGYVFCHLFGGYVNRQIEALLTGSNYPAINSADVRALSIPIPDYEEQRAIATVLSDMDAEIAALEQRRDKTCALKQGMMQELLTGRTRLL